MHWIRDLTDFIFLSDTPCPADILFIPGNGHAEPSEYAASLYREGLVPLILPSGRYSKLTGRFSGQMSGCRRYTGDFDTEWAFMRTILIENGVPASAVLKEDQATFTYENAIYSRAVTDSMGVTIRTALLVCLPVHARRARMYYETLFPDADIHVCPPSMSGLNQDNWYTSESGIHTVLGEVERCGSQFHDILCQLQGIVPSKFHFEYSPDGKVISKS